MSEKEHRVCHLCSKSRELRTPASLKEEHRKWVEQFTIIPTGVFICKACINYIQRHAGSDCQPRWLQNSSKTNPQCTVADCNRTSRGSTTITSCTVAGKHLQLARTDDISSLFLCNIHYQQLYRIINSPTPCATCFSPPKQGERYTRKCPDPTAISHHLKDTVGFDGNLTSDSEICHTCYKFQLNLLKLQKESPTLECLTSSFHSKIENLKHASFTSDVLLEFLSAKIGLRLVTIFEKEEAVLLPVLYSEFVEEMYSDPHNNNEQLISAPPTQNWLLTTLSLSFKDTLGVVCKHKRYGTLLYRKGSDLLKALSKALGVSKEVTKKVEYISKKPKQVLFTATQTADAHGDDGIIKACTALNKKLQKQAKSLIDIYHDNPHLCTSFSPESMLDMIDPLLVKCIKILTTPVRGRSKLHRAPMKHLYCLCTLLHTMNKQCHMPMQFLITDAAICFGKSSELLRILSKCGVTISLKTHDKIMMTIAKERHCKGIQDELLPNTLTIASIDNADILQRHAMVVTSKEKRSWHGTSIQCVQPLPESSILCDEELMSPSSCASEDVHTDEVLLHAAEEDSERNIQSHLPSTGRSISLAESLSHASKRTFPLPYEPESYLSVCAAKRNVSPHAVKRLLTAEGNLSDCAAEGNSAAMGNQSLCISLKCAADGNFHGPMPNTTDMPEDDLFITLPHASDGHLPSHADEAILPPSIAGKHSIITSPSPQQTKRRRTQTCEMGDEFSINSFIINSQEEKSVHDLQLLLLKYFCMKEASSQDIKLPGFPSFVAHKHYGSEGSEVGNVVYIDVMSLPADNKDTIMKVLKKLYNIFVNDLRKKWLIVVGDAKTYDIMQALKTKYGHRMEWLLPLPGDWHILFNYQKVLLKVYGDAGLLQLAKISGHRAETLTSLAQASHFKRTHSFLLQSFEVINRVLLKMFISFLEKDEHPESASMLFSFKASAGTLADMLSSISTAEDFVTFSKAFDECPMKKFLFGYTAFLESMSSKQDTIKFWHDYIAKNGLAYIALHTAIRNGDWVLRMAAIKMMAAVFCAFDRPIYQRLIPQHLADILCFPPMVLHHLKKGAISVHLSKTTGHAVALDELHEMKINRDVKFSIVRPSENLNFKVVNYMPFRAKCMNNLREQLGMFKTQSNDVPIPTSRDNAADQNIQAMLDYTEENEMFQDGDENFGLQNFLSNVKATPEQAKDLLEFRAIGQQEFEMHVSYKILGKPSTNAPQRKKRLNTFSSSKAIRQKQKQIEKEKKLQKICLKKQLVMLARGEKLPMEYDVSFNPLPSALVEPSGMPHKGNKSKTTDFLEVRYRRANVIVSNLPSNWFPDAVILEGMFLIQTNPPPGIVTFREYAEMLLDRFVVTHLRAGAKEVHILFDDPGQMKESPKEIERSKRDMSAKVEAQHNCSLIEDNAKVSSEWETDLINCRQCKKELCNYLSHALLDIVPLLLSEEQEFFTSGGFQGDRRNQCWSVGKSNKPQPHPTFRAEVEETDLRIWLHCLNSKGDKKLLYSPDTDVYHIGLPIIAAHKPLSDVYIQLKGRKNDAYRYMHVQSLIAALNADPDLASIPRQIRPQVLQSVYAATGCDYVSFFRGIGKVFFLNAFVQHASFITSGDPEGTLADFNMDQGFLAFVRLVGTAYFKKHISAFKARTPQSLFHSIEETSLQMKHEVWLGEIRKTVWERTAEEMYYVPSYEALKLHWSRCSWVLIYWSQAIAQTIEMPLMRDYGWYREDGKLKVQWESERNITSIKENVAYLTKGCRCKTGCSTRRCGCQRNSLLCGPSCHCVNCQNSTSAVNSTCKEVQEEVQEEILEEGEDDEYDMEVVNDIEDDDDQLESIQEFLEEIFGVHLDEEEEEEEEQEEDQVQIDVEENMM